VTSNSSDALDANQSNRQHRRQRFLHAFLLLTLSRGLAVVVQLVALPLALRALGTERYAAFLTLQSFVSWIGLAGFGLGPTLPRFISESLARHDQKAERDLIMSSIVFTLMVLATLATSLIVFGLFVPIRGLISASPRVSDAELRAGYDTIVLLTCGQLGMTISTAMRSGYQELHRSAFWTTLGNVVILVSLLVASRYTLNISLMATLLYGPIILFLWGDVGFLLAQRPYLFSLDFSLTRFLRMLGGHSSNALTMQLSFFVLVYSPTVLVAHMAGFSATAAFATVMQPLLLASSAFQLITGPLIPAIANAHSHRDFAWIKTAYRRTALLVMSAAVSLAAVLTAFGPQLFELWLGRDIGTTHLLFACFGFYFVSFTSSVFNFNVLAAMGQVRGTAKLYLFEAFLALGLGTALLREFGPAGMAAGLALGIGSVTAWYFPWRVYKVLNAGADGASAAP
jgi:O-antigen/teichoic acid export membrane protein